MTFQSFSWAVTMTVNSVPRPAPALLYSKFAPRRETKRRLYLNIRIQDHSLYRDLCYIEDVISRTFDRLQFIS